MKMPSSLDVQSISPNPNIVLGDVDGEIVALNMESSSYLHLNSSGSFIFGLLDGSEPRSLEWLCQRVQQEYQVDDATCRQDVGEFVTRCIDLNLLRAANGTPG